MLAQICPVQFLYFSMLTQFTVPEKSTPEGCVIFVFNIEKSTPEGCVILFLASMRLFKRAQACRAELCNDERYYFKLHASLQIFLTSMLV